jgi:predicted MFS family arabinose efflux permease
LLGYVYVFAGVWLIDPRRPLQYSQLIVRGVQLGLVSVGALTFGTALRLVLRQRLLATRQEQRPTVAQYRLSELMFLIVVVAVGLGFVNLFFDHIDRESQLLEIVLTIVVSFAAALPWLWGASQSQLSPTALALIVVSSLFLMVLNTITTWTVTQQSFVEALQNAGRQTAAYAIGATVNGLVLRALGFRWCGHSGPL